ncbi:MAG: nucleotidyltransferase family protein [Candidatus Binatus sp.]|uniref:nucleotidyltransferase family protein n=1 Tax=Candidatus Binatus sp. TaxID=2811406 RepID=UPI003BAE35AD
MEQKNHKASLSGIAVVILAAGRASRMGREKLLLMLGDKPVIRHVAETVCRSELDGISDTVVVANPRNQDSIRAVLAGLDLRIICNPSFEQGLGTSIATGVGAAVGSDASALLLVQGDQPFVNAEVLRRLIDEWREHQSAFVASSYDEITTTPVIFSRALFAEMAALKGDVGARSVLRNHGGRVITFPAWRGADLDTEEDYERVQQLFAKL